MPPSDEKKNGRITIQTGISILVMLGGLAGVWGTLSADQASQKERLTQLEKRVENDKQETRADVKEIKTDVKTVNESVQLILRKLDVMEASQRRRDTR